MADKTVDAGFFANLGAKLLSVTRFAKEHAGEVGGLLNLLGIRPDWWRQTSVSKAETESGQASSSDTLERVDRFGKREEDARAKFRALYGKQPDGPEQTPTQEQRWAYGLVLRHLSPGQREVLLEAFAFAGVRATRIKRTWKVRGQTPPQVPQPVQQRRRGQQPASPPSTPQNQDVEEEYAFTRAEAAWYVIQIGKDVLSAGRSRKAQIERAREIAKMLQNTAALENWRDQRAEIADIIMEALTGIRNWFGENAHDAQCALARIATTNEFISYVENEPDVCRVANAIARERNAERRRVLQDELERILLQYVEAWQNEPENNRLDPRTVRRLWITGGSLVGIVAFVAMLPLITRIGNLPALWGGLPTFWSGTSLAVWGGVAVASVSIIWLVRRILRAGP